MRPQFPRLPSSSLSFSFPPRHGNFLPDDPEKSSEICDAPCDVEEGRGHDRLPVLEETAETAERLGSLESRDSLRCPAPPGRGIDGPLGPASSRGDGLGVPVCPDTSASGRRDGSVSSWETERGRGAVPKEGGLLSACATCEEGELEEISEGDVAGVEGEEHCRESSGKQTESSKDPVEKKERGTGTERFCLRVRLHPCGYRRRRERERERQGGGVVEEERERGGWFLTLYLDSTLRRTSLLFSLSFALHLSAFSSVLLRFNEMPLVVIILWISALGVWVVRQVWSLVDCGNTYVRELSTFRGIAEFVFYALCFVCPPVMGFVAASFFSFHLSATGELFTELKQDQVRYTIFFFELLTQAPVLQLYALLFPPSTKTSQNLTLAGSCLSALSMSASWAAGLFFRNRHSDRVPTVRLALNVMWFWFLGILFAWRSFPRTFSAAEVEEQKGPGDRRRAMDPCSAFTWGRGALEDVPRFMGFPCEVEGYREESVVLSDRREKMDSSRGRRHRWTAETVDSAGHGEELRETSSGGKRRLARSAVGRVSSLLLVLDGPLEERRRERTLLLGGVSVVVFDLVSHAAVAGVMFRLSKDLGSLRFYWFGLTVAFLTLLDVANFWLVREDLVVQFMRVRPWERLWRIRLAAFCLSLSEIVILILTSLTLSSYKGGATLVISIVFTVLGVLWKFGCFVCTSPCCFVEQKGSPSLDEMERGDGNEERKESNARAPPSW
uniref:Transmembrane protein n=1 Tax=Chromera velia CCMP2878 TaxID=1169474 RepID=A0A0G4FPB1_9ALVE|eukprot:Cvel_18035.t1-p1 / transcript=Cvel_18035.t1 / gene=Cvel_18035 / organism=Chromera_velia_CCMP2878 / gene_product=hypothetical protein / transcript_product=hypothetical protein / location=Cvel_scaffold1472:35777-38360(-) / protein_length=725 / sequence_SO=supercontig / SO=protein_coding / is_pseudo=false